MPDGTNPTGGLDAQGQQNLRDWVAAGGVLVGLRARTTPSAPPG